jgi:hypothetical protein
VHDNFADADPTQKTREQCHPKAKVQIREVRRKEKGRERLRRRRRRVGRSRELSRSMFDTFWYITRDEDDTMEF